jgi:hypothetical protein
MPAPSTKPVAYPAQSPRLSDQVRELIRYKHYSLKTEAAYLYGVRCFVRWHGRAGAMGHPRATGATAVEAFLPIPGISALCFS